MSPTPRFTRDVRGVTLVEFAVVAPVMLLMIFGLMDLTFQTYVKSVLNGAVNDAARGGTIEANSVSQAALDARVTEQVKALVPSAAMTFKRLNYTSVSDIGQKEQIVSDNGNDILDPGECFMDTNNNGSRDLDRGRTGQGGADDFVRYTAIAAYQRFFPMGMFGMSPDVSVSATSVIRNQPYATQSSPSTVPVCP